MQIVERVRPYWAWLLSDVLVAGALVVVVLTGPDAGSVQARPGQFVTGRVDEDTPADTGTLTFPLVALSVRVTAPVTSGDRNDGLDRRTPPDDGSFLGLEVDLSPRTTYRIVTASTRAAAPTPVLALVVIADGRRYPVPDPAIDRLGGYPTVSGTLRGHLAVAGRPRDVRVEATLDGVRQTVTPGTGERTTGRAAGLYGTAATEFDAKERGCGSRTVTSGYRGEDDERDLPDCLVTGQVRTPYVEGLGWAASGKVWQIVDLDVGRSLRVERVAAGHPVQAYASVVRDDDLTVRIGGQVSLGSPRTNAGSSSAYDGDARAVVQVAEDAPPVAVRIEATYHRLRNRSNEFDRTAPVAPDVTVTWTETLS